jgi:sec-independent protein translocase protein TatB
VKDELERDLASDDLKRTMKEAREAMRDTEQSVRASADEAREEFEQMRTAVASDRQPQDRAPGQAPLEQPREAEETSQASSTEAHGEDIIDETQPGQRPDAYAHTDPVTDPRSETAPAAAPGPEDDRRSS